jgi:hypothetical protein
MATPAEQELAQQLFAGQGKQSMGAMEAIKEAFLAIAPGLKDVISETKAEMKQQLAHGAHELAAALFTGNAFVMYQRGGKDDHGVHGPEQSPQASEHAQGNQGMQQEASSQQMERGGRGM